MLPPLFLILRLTTMYRLWLLMSLSVFNAHADATADPKMAWIETSEIDGRLHVQAYVKSPKVAELEYDLISAKSGRSGTSLTKQAGKVNAEAGQTYPLTKLRLGLAKEDTYRLTLNVYEKGKLIAEDTVVFP